MQEVCDRHLKALKLAVVDDSRAFGLGLKSLMLPYVASVDVYQEGRIALDKFREFPPDVIILDLEMPELDGFEMITEIKACPALQAVPILVLTGKEDTLTMARIIAHGADGFVAKSEVRDLIVVHLLALARLREVYQRSIRGKQLEAIKALLGTCKHDFGNALAAIDGKLTKLERSVPELASNDSLIALRKWTQRLLETLKKIENLEAYEEQSYVGATRMLTIDSGRK